MQQQQQPRLSTKVKAPKTLLACEVSGPISVSPQKRPSPVYHEIAFRTEPPPQGLHYIQFRNYYVAYVTIKQLVQVPVDNTLTPQSARTTTSTAEVLQRAAIAAGAAGSRMQEQAEKQEQQQRRKLVWRTILHRYQLMPNAHLEEGSQDYVTIAASDFSEVYEPDNVVRLRIYLLQPSPCWRSYGLRHIECHFMGANVHMPLVSERKKKEKASRARAVMICTTAQHETQQYTANHATGGGAVNGEALPSNYSTRDDSDQAVQGLGSEEFRHTSDTSLKRAVNDLSALVRDLRAATVM